jgi:hypothetical protein
MKTNTNSKSMKGKKGTVGAPKKSFKFPKARFTYERAGEFNDNVCELTARKRVDEAVTSGVLVRLLDIPQKGGAVGRPQRSFLLATLAKDAPLYGSTPKTPVKARKVVKKAKEGAKPGKVTDTATVPLTVDTGNVVDIQPPFVAPAVVDMAPEPDLTLVKPTIDELVNS